MNVASDSSETASTRVLFRAGEGGYAGYRIPALLALNDSVLLLCCEARRRSQHDWGEIDLLGRRSEDGGATWSEPERWAHPGPARPKNPVAVARGVAEPGTVTTHNPVLLPGAHPGEVHLLYGLEYRYLFHRRSDDAGRTWSEPREVTAAAAALRQQYPWETIAPGPGHGVRLPQGRLVAPVWYSLGQGNNLHKPSRTGAVWSEDQGVTWQAGALVPETPVCTNANEASVAVLPDGQLVLSVRSLAVGHRRAIAWSADGGATWSEPYAADDLVEPIGMGGLTSAGHRLYFTHPDTLEPRAGQTLPPAPGTSRARRNVSLHTSDDAGRTWRRQRTIDPGPSGYSDVAVTPAGHLHVFYERLVQADGAETRELVLVSWPTASDR
jgi:sialidase-1